MWVGGRGQNEGLKWVEWKISRAARDLGEECLRCGCNLWNA